MIIVNGIGMNIEVEEAKRELNELRREYASLLAEYDELTGAVRRHLETEYMMLIGKLEYRLFSLQFQARRLKREISIYQAAQNRGEVIFAEEVETILDREFAEYKAALDERQEKIRRAEEHHFCPKLSEEETRAIRDLYHDLVRKLHPDLNPDLPDGARQLWEKVVTAYRNSDWLELNILADRVEDLLEWGRKPDRDLTRMEEILAEQQRIAQKIGELRKHMQELCSRPPFTYRKLLEDIAAVNARRRELQESIREFEEHIAELTAIRDALKGEEK